MAKAKQAASSLADDLAKHRPAPRFKTWFDKLPAAQRERLSEIRRRFRCGRYDNTMSEIHRFCCDREKLTVSLCQFSRWLKAA